MSDEEELKRPTPRVRLRLMKSPVVGSSDSKDAIVEPDLRGFEQWRQPATLGAARIAAYQGEHKGIPLFRKFEDASLLELFTDLFFAASYTVFTQTQQVSNTNTLAAYIGYFCTLWVTWLLVALYDVRFVTDCVFERVTRAVHLGVLIGFAVVAPKFDPIDQDRKTMRIMSGILSISRFTLAVEYLSVLWHVRKFKKALLPIGFQLTASLIAAFAYLAITFRFRDYNSRIFVLWYIMAFVELTATTVASAYWEVLALTRTHLMRRLTLLTVIILGDGIIILAQDVVTIVQTPKAWNSLTIGVVTASCAAIYSVFLVYFDWIRERYLPRWRQIYWVSLHLPFHLALVLFMNGFTQLIMWTKIFDVIWNQLSLNIDFMIDYDRIANSTSLDIAQDFANMAEPFFRDYGKKSSLTKLTYTIAIGNITQLPDSTWSDYPKILKAVIGKEPMGDGFEESDTYRKLYNAVWALTASMYSTLFEAYGVEASEEVAEGKDWNEIIINPEFQQNVVDESLNRFMIVFVYGYIASGMTLIFMVLLAVISRKHPWKPWPVIRNVINILAGLVMAGLAGLAWSERLGTQFILDGMSVTTMTIIWLFILVLTHAGSATPAFAEASNKGSASLLRGDEEVEASDQRTLSCELAVSGNRGRATRTNSSNRAMGDEEIALRERVGHGGTSYGQLREQSPDRLSHDATPANRSTPSRRPGMNGDT